jgi:hypothetical protein
MKAVTKDQCRTKGWKNGRVNPFLNLIKKINQACSLSFELNFAILFFEPNETNLLQRSSPYKYSMKLKRMKLGGFPV